MTSFTKLDGMMFPASRDGDDRSRLRLVRKSAKRHRQLKRRWHSAVQSHDAGHLAMVLREWVSSGLVKIWAAVEVAATRPLNGRPTLQDVIKETKGLRLTDPTWEPVISRRKPKSEGFRYYSAFGLQNRTLHRLMRALYSPFFVPKPFQYEYRKDAKISGVALAIKEGREAILAGNIYFAHLDVVSCYPSFDEKEQHKIVPALKKMTTHNTGGHLNVVPKGPSLSLSVIESEARRGAPQGSALSPLLWGKIVSCLEWKSQTLLFNWADNFLILGPSKEVVEQATKTLIDQVAQLLGGSFSLSVKEKGHASAGFQFLGHRLVCWIQE